MHGNAPKASCLQSESIAARAITLTFGRNKRHLMKRDMDIIRLLLLQQESGEDPPELAQYDEQLIVYNSALMLDAGFIIGEVITDHNGDLAASVIIRMTWAGHDFLDSTRDPTIWKKAKERVLKPGISWSFSILVEFLKAEAQRQLGSALGLPPAP